MPVARSLAPGDVERQRENRSIHTLAEGRAAAMPDAGGCRRDHGAARPGRLALGDRMTMSSDWTARDALLVVMMLGMLVMIVVVLVVMPLVMLVVMLVVVMMPAPIGGRRRGR